MSVADWPFISPSLDVVLMMAGGLAREVRQGNSALSRNGFDFLKLGTRRPLMPPKSHLSDFGWRRADKRAGRYGNPGPPSPLIHHGVPQHADLRHLDLDNVARLEPLRRRLM